MIMLPHCAVNFFNNKIKQKYIFFVNDYAAPCQWWHACLGLPTPGLHKLVATRKSLSHIVALRLI